MVQIVCIVILRLLGGVMLHQSQKVKVLVHLGSKVIAQHHVAGRSSSEVIVVEEYFDRLKEVEHALIGELLGGGCSTDEHNLCHLVESELELVHLPVH